MAKKRGVKIVWGAGERIKGEWHLGLWGLYDRTPGVRHSGLAISVRGALRWAAVLAVIGYFAAATAVYVVIFRKNPYNLVTWTDTVLLPVRLGHVKELRGKGLIEEGLADLKERRWSEGVMKIRVGLTRSPHDWRARLALGQFYAVTNQRVLATKVLTEDFDFGYPGRKYLEAVFTLATEGEDYDVIVDICQRFRDEPNDQAWRKLQRNIALLRGNRADEVLREVEASKTPPTEADRETRVTALIELKRPAEALDALAEWSKLPLYDRVLVQRLRVRASRDAGRRPELEEAIKALRALAPADPRTLAYIITQLWLAGQEAEATSVLEEYFRRLSAAPANLMAVVKAVGDAKAKPLLQRCADEAAAHGFNGNPMRMALAQAHIACGQWAEASQLLSTLKVDKTKAEPGEIFLREWLGRLVAVALTADAPQRTALLEVLERRPLSMRVYRQSCEVLLAAKRYEAAGDIVDLAERSYPNHPALKPWRAQIAEALKPAPVAASPAPVVGPKPDEFFKGLAVAEQENRWSDAVQMIRDLRVSKPRWLPTREAEILERQLRAAVHTQDTLEFLGAAKLLLDGSAARAERILAIARELAEAGDKPSANLLLQEVLRRNPTHQAALKLKAEWAPKKPAAPEAEKPAEAAPKPAS